MRKIFYSSTLLLFAVSCKSTNQSSSEAKETFLGTNIEMVSIESGIECVPAGERGVAYRFGYDQTENIIGIQTDIGEAEGLPLILSNIEKYRSGRLRFTADAVLEFGGQLVVTYRFEIIRSGAQPQNYVVITEEGSKNGVLNCEEIAAPEALSTRRGAVSESPMSLMEEILPSGVELPGGCELNVNMTGTSYGFKVTQADRSVQIRVADEGTITRSVSGDKHQVVYKATLKNTGSFVDIPGASKTSYFVELTQDAVSGEITALSVTEDAFPYVPLFGHETIDCK